MKTDDWRNVFETRQQSEERESRAAAFMDRVAGLMVQPPRERDLVPAIDPDGRLTWEVRK